MRVREKPKRVLPAPAKKSRSHPGPLQRAKRRAGTLEVKREGLPVSSPSLS